jgi:hypothetical protein
MSVLDKAKKHYTNIINQEPIKVEVPEWDSTLYAKPSISLAKLGEIMELSNAGKSAEAMALTLIYRLIDEEGNPVFRKAEKNELLRSVDPDVLSRIITTISDNTPSDEDVAKN